VKKLIEQKERIFLMRESSLPPLGKDSKDYVMCFYACKSEGIWKLFDDRHKDHILEFNAKGEVLEFMKAKI